MKTAAREQLQMSQTFSGAALHAPLDEFGSVFPAAWFRLALVVAILPICSISYFIKEVENRLEKTGSR